MKLVCSIGEHEWELFSQPRIGRYCTECNRLEYLSRDKKRWNRGVWGAGNAANQRNDESFQSMENASM